MIRPYLIDESYAYDGVRLRFVVKVMRVLSLSFIAAMVAAVVSAQTASRVTVLANHEMPAKEMHVVPGKSSQVDVPPKLISGTAPIYPISRLKRGESRSADITCTVDETGHTRDFSVLNTNYQYFANHAILAVQNWRFQPATKNGHPVPCRVHIPFKYRPGYPPKNESR
jgi:TonB family protein